MIASCQKIEVFTCSDPLKVADWPFVVASCQKTEVFTCSDPLKDVSRVADWPMHCGCFLSED